MNSFIGNISSLIRDPRFTAWVLDAMLISLVVLALAGGVCALWRRSSAATRHLIWFLAVVSLPCLLLLSCLLPSRSQPLWSVSTGLDSANQVSLTLEFAPAVPALNAPSSLAAVTIPALVRDRTDVGRKVAAHFSANWMMFGLAAWFAGAALVLLYLVIGQFRLHTFSRTAQPLRDADWTRLLSEIRETLQLRRTVVLLQSADDVMPMTWGWWRPVVLLPAEATQWPVERRQIVLLHELAHVKRWDCLTQLAAKMVCAFYWFNPLVWFAARQMGDERERACDDLVLNAGCRASDYAGHLVDIAGSFRRLPQMAAIAMARPSGLESRITAIVDASRNRRLRSVSAVVVLGLIGGIAICLGGTGITAAGGPGKSNSLRQQQLAQLEAFSLQKEKQSQALAAAAGETISPEYQKFFDAATSGDGETVTNLFESFKQRHPQYSHPHQHSNFGLRTSYWSPVLEICLAYAAVMDSEPAYTQMAVDDIINSIPAGSIYFGGTDPGRGLPTAFSKSHTEADPFYTLTQNALADFTYLEYLRKTYGDQKELLNQLAEACRKDSALQALSVKWLAMATKLESLGDPNADDSEWNAASNEANAAWNQRDERVRALTAGVQARAGTSLADPKTIYIPISEDSQACVQELVRQKQLANTNGRIVISGQKDVMALNGLLVKIIFDKNPGHEFFIEESYALDWMYPYLEPHGLIFKLNRQPLAGLSDAVVQQDRDFWQPRVTKMIGGWLADDTSVKDVAAFAEKVYLQHDLSGFTGDPAFVQNEYANKMFSKFRSSIAGLYAWRVEHATDATEKAQMAQAADFAFRQALALCPYSPELAARYADFLKGQNREADAKLVTDLAAQFPKQK